MKNCGNCKYYKQGELLGICTNENNHRKNKYSLLKKDSCKKWEGTNEQSKL